MRIVYPPTLDWGYMFQRPQQLALALARRGHQFVFSNKTQVSGRAPEPSPQHPGVTLVHDWDAFRRQIGPQDVLFASWAIYHDMVGRAGLTVFDSLDQFPDWAAYEQEMVAKADAVTCTATVILRDTLTRRQDATLVPNACDPAHWLERRPVSQFLQARPTPRVLFSGYVGTWVDTILLRNVVRRCRGLSFVVVGPPTPLLEEIAEEPNLHCVGEVPYADLPGIFAGCDAAVLPFHVTDPVAIAADPIKAYEYLAAGLPVVATDIPEVRKLAPHVQTTTGVRDFAAALLEAIESDTCAARTARRAAVAAHTWDARAAAIETVILGAAAEKGLKLA